MATFPFSTLKRPIPGESASGISLEDANDNEFMQFLARIEGLLPETFANFDRAAIDFDAEYAALTSLLSRSIDLRLLVALAKLSILDRNLDGFAQSLDAIRDCLETRWDDVHPLPIEGDPIMRLIALQSLDDMPHTVLPLQHAPLFTARRFGVVTLRAFLIATGKVAANPASEDEPKLKDQDIGTAVEQADLAEISGARATAQLIETCLDAIERTYNAHAGGGELLRLPRVRSLAGDVRRFLDDCAVAKDPSLAPAPADAGDPDTDVDAPSSPSTSSGPFASIGEVRQAMSACLAYFSIYEASSPARLILKQAEVLIGKSFFEALQVLAPDYAGQASVKLGRDLPLNISIESLSRLFPENEDDTQSSEASADEAPEQAFQLTSRPQTMELLQKIGLFFKSQEPSSPIPMLLEQARSVAGRDFTSLLREVLPNSAFRIDE